MNRHLTRFFLAGLFFISPSDSFAGLLGDVGDRIDQGVRDLSTDLQKPPSELIKRAEQAANDLVRDLQNTHYETNKWDRMRETEEGGWVAAWADDVAEKDVLKGIVAAGVSIYAENPEPFLRWVRALIKRTTDSLVASARERFPAAVLGELQNIAADAIRTAISTKGEINFKIRNYDTFDFKAGAIDYSGANMAGDTVVSRTWGMKPFVAFRWHPSSGPLAPRINYLQETQNRLRLMSQDAISTEMRSAPSLEVARLAAKAKILSDDLKAHGLSSDQMDRVYSVATRELQQRGRTTQPVAFADNLGITYEKVPYSDGTFGARITEQPAQDTPAFQLGLRLGDIVLTLNRQPFRSPDDVRNHHGFSPIEYLDSSGNKRINTIKLH